MIRKESYVHLEALAGYINDEDKLVTYKWLSKELGIHVNLSKQILFEYWENRREDRDPITATFLLIGHLGDGGMRVEVVKEADLPSAKKNFSKIISEHVYSLQKCLPQIELLAITDKGDFQQSAVRCTESVIRSDYEMEVLRWGSRLANNKSAKNVQNSTIKVQQQPNAEAKQADQANNTSKESTAQASAHKSAEKTQKSAFNNLFAKAIDRQNKNKATPASSGDTKNKAVAAKNSPPMNAWFEAAKKSKSLKKQSANDDPVESAVDENLAKDHRVSLPETSDNSKSKAAATSENSGTSQTKKNAWFEAKKTPMRRKERLESSNDSIDFVDEDGNREESSEKRRTVKRKSPEKNTGSSQTGAKKKAAASSRGKKRQSSSKNENISKRRKRIVVAESSEDSSDSEMENVRESESAEESQVVEKIKNCPSPPLVKCEGGRRKVRKLVDKTFMDADGYFVTQKEYVYESCSDKEEDVQVEIIKPSISEPASQNTNKRKQATLLNFFKKS